MGCKSSTLPEAVKSITLNTTNATVFLMGRQFKGAKSEDLLFIFNLIVSGIRQFKYEKLFN